MNKAESDENNSQPQPLPRWLSRLLEGQPIWELPALPASFAALDDEDEFASLPTLHVYPAATCSDTTATPMSGDSVCLLWQALLALVPVKHIVRVSREPLSSPSASLPYLVVPKSGQTASVISDIPALLCWLREKKKNEPTPPSGDISEQVEISPLTALVPLLESELWPAVRAQQWHDEKRQRGVYGECGREAIVRTIRYIIYSRRERTRALREAAHMSEDRTSAALRAMECMLARAAKSESLYSATRNVSSIYATALTFVVSAHAVELDLCAAEAVTDFTSRVARDIEEHSTTVGAIR